MFTNNKFILKYKMIKIKINILKEPSLLPIPSIKKKKFGSTVWKFDAQSNVQLKRIYNTEEKQNDWPLEFVEREIFRTEESLINHQEFFNRLVKAIARVRSVNLRFKLVWALKRFPEEETKIFAIFIDTKEFSDEDIGEFFNQNLILSKFAGYYVISHFNEIIFFEKAIEFYERFDQLILPDKSEPFLLYGNRNDSELVLLFYCDVGGNGMLIKSKGTDTKISPEREIEILRLGAIMEVDVPQRSAVIKLNPEDELVTEFSAKKNNNILIQKLIPGAFPLYSATDQDIEILTRTNCINLGKMVIFDIVAGSWDRHSGNYVIHPRGMNEFSLAEIDFGLFDPSWYPPVDFKESENISFNVNTTPPIYSPREGWALTRHPGVTEMVKKCDKTKVVKGMSHALQKLKNFVKTNTNLTEIFSEDLAQRMRSMFEQKSKVRILLDAELSKLGVDVTIFSLLLES
jgi:hypothetical protein